jgi:hypothetical protein
MTKTNKDKDKKKKKKRKKEKNKIHSTDEIAPKFSCLPNT